MTKEEYALIEEQMKKRAAKGYFVRDLEKDRVYCPTGEILRRKAVKKSGEVRYANKMACKQCEDREKCTRSPWKEVDFPDGVKEARNLNWLKAKEGK
ncbi:MAG: hypothetical protein NC231_06240 [Bacillus sp. (in: Bacteria)]|nr:hypothetical protein [Bacillus sp. (in: firmicutes)]MCM1426616.1 hypothetical protein [Eubacterium sp.]